MRASIIYFDLRPSRLAPYRPHDIQRHRFARREQVEACYPQFRQFLALKRQYDPDELFQSNWSRHYRTMFN